jgi:hypothetical protein
METIESVESVKSIESVKPIESIESVESVKSIESVESIKPVIESIEPIDLIESISSKTNIAELANIIDKYTYIDTLRLHYKIKYMLQNKRMNYYNDKFKKDMFEKMEHDDKYTELINMSKITEILIDHDSDMEDDDQCITSVVRLKFNPICNEAIDNKHIFDVKVRSTEFTTDILIHADSSYDDGTICPKDWNDPKRRIWHELRAAKYIIVTIRKNSDDLYDMNDIVYQSSITSMYDEIKDKINMKNDEFTKFINQIIHVLNEFRINKYDEIDYE